MFDNPYKLDGKICVSFSGGSSSGFMLYNLLQHNAKEDLCVIFANTGLEHEETLKFVRRCAEEWDVYINWVEYAGKKELKSVTFDTASRKGEPFDKLVSDEKCLPNVWMRFCTNKLKIKLIKQMAQKCIGKNYTECIGIRYDEPKRWSRMLSSPLNKGRDITMPMFDAKHTLEDVTKFWDTYKFKLGIPRELGNCQGCFLKGTKSLKRVLEIEPTALDWWAGKEKESGRTFKKNGPTYSGLISMLPTTTRHTDDDLPCTCTE